MKVVSTFNYMEERQTKAVLKAWLIMSITEV